MKRLLTPVFLGLITCTFFACQPKPSGGVVENTWWILSSARQGNKNVAPIGDVTIKLHFQANQLTGEGPCNSYFAGYTVKTVNLEISDIGATEKMCDAIDQENAYLGMLVKAKAFSVLKDRLEIFCENGRLTFTPMLESAVKELEFKNGTGQLAAMFPVLEGDVMPHLFPILRVDNPGNYPYEGTLVDTSLYKYFDAESSGVWRETGGEVLAVGKFGDLYICRVPGRYVSSDIALYRIANNRMTRMETVAWAWCDEGWCNQQDAWLTDMNQDGRIDIVQHYTLTDDKGKIREERMTALLQNENGNFVENKDLNPDRSKFKMAKI